jgi:ribonuclease P protein component
MLAKNKRVDKKTLEKIFKDGRFLNSLNLTFKYIKNPLGPTYGTPHRSDLGGSANQFVSPKISFITPKSVSKLAVKRNSLRRKGYRALEKYFSLLPSSIVGVFLFKKYQEDLSILENEIKTIFNKIN